MFSGFVLRCPHNPAMRKVRPIALIVFALALLVTVIGKVWNSVIFPGPSFHGRSVVYWMNYDYPGPGAPQEFRMVWKGLGSNAVPFLVKALKKSDRPLPNITFRPVWRKLPRWLKHVVTAPSPPADTVRSRAASALGILAGEAKGGVPALLEVMQADESHFVRQVASNALTQIDPEAAARAGIAPPLENPQD